MPGMGTEQALRQEADLRDRLEKLVELEMQVSRLETAAAGLLTDAGRRDQAAQMLRDLRDLLERESGAAERELQTFRAEQGLSPDD